MIDAKEWCERALAAVFSLWDGENHHALRESQSPVGNGTAYYPTATFHAITAIGECGIWDKGVEREKGNIKTSYLEIRKIENFSSAEDVLNTLVHKGEAGDWVKAVLDQSTNTTHYPTRQSLVVGGLFQALRILVMRAGDKHRGEILDYVATGLPEATKRLLASAEIKAGDTATEAQLSSNSHLSPYLLLHVAYGLQEREALIDWIKKVYSNSSGLISKLVVDPATSDTIKNLEAALVEYFERQVERLMARRHVPSDPQYDPTSLAFALRGLALMKVTARTTPLFRAAAKAVLDGQFPDGCWPDGVSVSFSHAGDTLQQPSVEVALQLAQSLFRPALLIEHNPDEIELLKDGIGAFRKTAQYLASSFNEVSLGSRRNASGWVSDRVRQPRISETWITAMAARFFNLLWLAERACTRAETLAEFKVAPTKVSSQYRKEPANESQAHVERPRMSERWIKDVTEPDSTTKPTEVLLTKVIKVIEQQQEEGAYFLRPLEESVSFIIFGPPGSGKTFMVKYLAKTLGWPLLILNPGHFIQKGLEFIEATSAKIFAALMQLDHTVVFFDECDELFRDRETKDTARNILSFATASMLPKLQDLHDARRVIFFLGTNYLERVDPAIRRKGRFDDILMFDLPDDQARETLIKGAWDNRKDKDNRELNADTLKRAIVGTTGWQIKEIKDHVAEMLAKDKPFQARASLDDYVDWIKGQGQKDLEARKFDRITKEVIEKRWLEVQHNAEILHSQAG